MKELNLIGAIRVLAASVGGAVTYWLVELGIDVDKELVIGLFTAVMTGVYYLAVDWLKKVFPFVGKLLIVDKQPEYKQ